MNVKQWTRRATAASLALALSTAWAAGDIKNDATSTRTPPAKPLTGKQKATAIGATTGAVAGAVVGGPVGAVVGAGIGGYVGHEGTDANGRPPTARSSPSGSMGDGTVRNAQAALNGQGYDAGAVDGQFGPNTQGAVRRFQADRGLAQTGTLDDATLAALGVSR
ncbi:MAG: peptidoglycan-binding domain-containing protein [Burkholderiales bacterium]